MHILYFSDQWDDKWRRRQQFASRLAMNSEVIVVEYPLPLSSLVKRCMGKADIEATNRWNRSRRYGFTFKPQHNISIITPLVPFRQFDQDGLSLALVKSRITKHLQGEYRTIVTHPFWGKKFYQHLGIKGFDLYDITEDFTKLKNIPGDKRDKIIGNDEYLTGSSKAVVCSSQSLYDQKLPKHGNVHLIPNGVDTDRLNQGLGKVDLRSKYGLSDGNRILLYAGGMNDRFDHDIVIGLLKAKPEWVLFVVGSYDGDDPKIKAMQALPNCHFMGQVGLEETGRYINTADVCLIPHKVDALTFSQSTQKLYDYMALGKPVVATPILPEEVHVPGVIRATGLEEWVESIDKAARLPKEISIQMIKNAENNSWHQRYIKYYEALESKDVHI